MSMMFSIKDGFIFKMKTPMSCIVDKKHSKHIYDFVEDQTAYAFRLHLTNHLWSKITIQAIDHVIAESIIHRNSI